MTQSLITPCLWFDDEAERAAELYVRTFPGARITAVSRYPSSGDNPSGKPPGSVLTVELEVAGQRFTALNGGPYFEVGMNISFFVEVETPAEVDRLAAALLEGGSAPMALGEYPWSERYAWVQDRFGVSWQLMASSGKGTRIAPCLMFTGPQHGRAEAALKRYAEIFPDGRVESLARYAVGEGPEGAIKHGRVTLGGQTLIAMDGHVDHAATFDEGVSLQVSCADQAELDRYWAALTDGGEESQCGWLKDRFGVSWQVVPAMIAAWMTHPDPAARERTFRAMMPMKKLDIATLEAALHGA